MRRTHRTLKLALILGMVAASCGGQEAPERVSVSVPNEIVPDFVVGQRPDEALPVTGECTIGVGAGARVLGVLEESGVEPSVHPGDIILEFVGVSVSSREAVWELVSRHRIGDVVTLSGTRADRLFEATMEVVESDDDPGSPTLPLVLETKIEPTSPDLLLTDQASTIFARPTIIGGQIFFYDPLSSSWTRHLGVPSTQLVGLGSHVYAVVSELALSVVRLEDGDIRQFSSDPFEAVAPDGTLLEFIPVSFGNALASVGDLLLVSGTAERIGGTNNVIYALDLSTGQIVWGRPLGPSDSGSPYQAFQGFRSPSGDRAVVGIAEVDPATGSRSDINSYIIINESGDVTVPQGHDRLTPTSAVTGWFDDNALFYVLPGQPYQGFSWSLNDGTHTDLFVVSEDDTILFITLTPIGDGRHITQILTRDVRLIDVIDLRNVRYLSRSCAHFPGGGLLGGASDG